MFCHWLYISNTKTIFTHTKSHSKTLLFVIYVTSSFVSSQVFPQPASKKVYVYNTRITCRNRCSNAQISNANYRRLVPIILKAKINITQKSQSFDAF